MADYIRCQWWIELRIAWSRTLNLHICRASDGNSIPKCKLSSVWAVAAWKKCWIWISPFEQEFNMLPVMREGCYKSKWPQGCWNIIDVWRCSRYNDLFILRSAVWPEKSSRVRGLSRWLQLNHQSILRATFTHKHRTLLERMLCMTHCWIERQVSGCQGSSCMVHLVCGCVCWRVA